MRDNIIALLVKIIALINSLVIVVGGIYYTYVVHYGNSQTGSNLVPEKFFLPIIGSILAALIQFVFLYGFGEIIQLLYNISLNTDSETQR